MPDEKLRSINIFCVPNAEGLSQCEGIIATCSIFIALCFRQIMVLA